MQNDTDLASADTQTAMLTFVFGVFVPSFDDKDDLALLVHKARAYHELEITDDGHDNIGHFGQMTWNPSDRPSTDLLKTFMEVRQQATESGLDLEDLTNHVAHLALHDEPETRTCRSCYPKASRGKRARAKRAAEKTASSEMA